MSNTKQSSVEFFLYGMASLLGEFENKSLPQERIMALFEQAKAMHKEEIIDSVGVGSQFDRDYLYGYHDKAEQYYNETFGGNNENNN